MPVTTAIVQTSCTDTEHVGCVQTYISRCYSQQQFGVWQSCCTRGALGTSAERLRRLPSTDMLLPCMDQRRGVDAAEPERGELAPLSPRSPCKSLQRA